MRRASIALLLAFVALSTASGSSLRTLTLADLRHTVLVGDPHISPDGRSIVVKISRRDYDKDKLVTNLVLIDVKSHAQRVLVHERSIGSVDWSPDGRFIAYTTVPDAGEEHAMQLFVLPMNGGEPLQLTHEKNGVDDVVWRPDGKAFAYTAKPEPPDAKAREHHEDAFNVTEEAWTEQAPTATDALYAIGAGGGKSRRIGGNDLRVHGGFTYAADGTSLFVTRIRPGAQPNQYLASQLVRVNVRNGETTVLPEISSTQGDPVRSLDGSHLAFDFTNPHGPMQQEIGLADRDGKHPVWISRPVDRNLDSVAFMPDGSVLAVASDRTNRRIFRMTATTHAVLPTGDLQVYSAPSVAGDGTIAFAGVSASRPADVYVIHPGVAQPVRMTDANPWLAHFKIPASRTIAWKTADGLTADGVLIYPPNWKAGTKAPLLLYIHGGPTAQSLVSFSGFAYVLASDGWFVFEPNYRGSDGLGLKFARTTVPHITSVPGDDIERGVSAVLQLGVADPNRMAVSGWSEGGLMTSWLITHDTRWKAAVSGAAVNEWVQYAAMTDAKDFGPEFIGPKPWNDPQLLELYRSESPLTYAANVKTPTLILSDAGDFRVPTPLAYEFYHAIRATGTPVKFVVWPVNGHFPSDPIRTEDVYSQWQAWLEQYLK